jgi:serine/threonine-protein kinase RsbT
MVMTLAKLETNVKISTETDVTMVSLKAMKMAEIIGFNKNSCYAISTAVSELARNIYKFARSGKINIKLVKMGKNKGIEIIAEDNGPGIADLSNAMKDNFSTSNSLGLGLPSVKRLMDEFNIETGLNQGTKITTRKWL